MYVTRRCPTLVNGMTPFSPDHWRELRSANRKIEGPKYYFQHIIATKTLERSVLGQLSCIFQKASRRNRTVCGARPQTYRIVSWSSRSPGNRMCKHHSEVSADFIYRGRIISISGLNRGPHEVLHLETSLKSRNHKYVCMYLMYVCTYIHTYIPLDQRLEVPH
jgi:hypothetical protein